MVLAQSRTCTCGPTRVLLSNSCSPLGSLKLTSGPSRPEAGPAASWGLARIVSVLVSVFVCFCAWSLCAWRHGWCSCCLLPWGSAYILCGPGAPRRCQACTVTSAGEVSLWSSSPLLMQAVSMLLSRHLISRSSISDVCGAVNLAQGEEGLGGWLLCWEQFFSLATEGPVEQGDAHCMGGSAGGPR